MSKVLIVAIDSLDPKVLLDHRAELPNLDRLVKESPTLVAQSVYPTDSIPAWMSAFTGLSPPNHGVLYVFDIFDPMLSDLSKLSTTHLAGGTFWDVAARAGKRCVILHPILFHPPWDVNGLMVTKSNAESARDDISKSFEMAAMPASTGRDYGFPSHGAKVWGGHPGEKNMLRWARFALDSMEEEADRALRVSAGEPWDLFFVYFNQLDIVQHRLWRFFDRDDPLYEDDAKLSPVIPEFYRRIDRIIGRFMESHPDANIVVVSDHGHRVRPYKTVNLPEHLRRAGYAGKEGAWSSARGRARALLRKGALAAITGLRIEPYVIRVVARSEMLTKGSKALYSSKRAGHSMRGRATISTFAGVKSYPFGGVEVNPEGLSVEAFDATCEDIVAWLSSLKAPDGRNLFRWVDRRERRFPGPYSSRIFPDIVFELDHDYGVGWETYGGLFGVSKDHRVASGGHSKDAVFLIGGRILGEPRRTMDLVDVAPTILDMLGVDPAPCEADGRSLFRPR